ncbi:SUKH-4 family immunity protein [Kitasatospora sp. NPDC085879]|uniref:SUKH-4 family immunity protein n=1 Tax=Kitasatospora sp. NPDC085879 TaxID=3154769 RepID=UPI0034139A46
MTNDGSPQAVSVAVDCAGQSLESAVAAAGRAAGEAGAGVHLRLERVELAGPLVSSDEPKRITSCGSRVVSELVGRPVTIALPADADDRPEAVAWHDLPAAPDELLWLAAAAALELPCSGLQVWRVFAVALTGRPVSVEQLTEFAARRPEITVEGNAVRFADRVAHRDVRARLPLSDVQQRAVHRALVGLRSDAAGTDETVAAYLGAARPVHAALAGELGEWLTDPDFLVESGWYGLGLGLALAYPEGVPLGGLAGDLQCLLQEGLAAPASHEEWLAWVHHALLSRGLGGAADEVAARVGLPWRTVWSRWQWPSGLAPLADPIPLADEVHLVEREDGVAFAIRREDEDDWDVEYEWLWNVETGEFLGGPAEDLLDEVEADDGTGRAVRRLNGAWGSLDTSERAELARRLPWVPRAVDEAVQCAPTGTPGGTLWVFSGRCGLFGALVDEKRLAQLPPVPHGRPGYSLAGRTAWPKPAVSLTAPAGREELEQAWAFGPGACRPVRDDRIPAGIRDGETRRFLAEVGWPITEGLAGLRTTDVASEDLRPSDGDPELWEGLGTFQGSPVLVDGRTGEVRHGYRAAESDPFPLMAGTLDRFLRIVLLHHAALTAPVLLGHHDGGDLEQAVADWVSTADPAATDGGFWEHRYFVPSLYDVRTSGDQ